MGVGIKRKIRDWLDLMSVEGYTINDDLTVDVLENVYLDGKLSEFPDYVKFGRVDGYFSCEHNGMTSLAGCPEAVGGIFYCSFNKLVSLEGCPKTAGKGFYCWYNDKTFTIEDVRRFCKVTGPIKV